MRLKWDLFSTELRPCWKTELLGVLQPRLFFKVVPLTSTELDCSLDELLFYLFYWQISILVVSLGSEKEGEEQVGNDSSFFHWIVGERSTITSFSKAVSSETAFLIFISYLQYRHTFLNQTPLILIDENMQQSRQNNPILTTLF